MKQFRTLIIGSLVGEAALINMKYSDVQEAYDHILGYAIWTHEIITYADQVELMVLALFPEMMPREGENFEARAERLLATYGEFVNVPKGNLERNQSPVETLQEISGDKPIIVIVGGGDDD
jgi:hypothetical protein